jgi:hypothetical protein
LTLGGVARDALRAYYGSVDAAAFALGEGNGRGPLDPSLMCRELEAQKFGRLNACDEAKAVVTAAWHKHFGHPDDPKAHARRVAIEIRERLAMLEQFIEFA